jgi:hypothetical protein
MFQLTFVCGREKGAQMAEVVRDYDIVVIFRGEDLSEEVKAELEGWLPADPKKYIGLSYDCAARDGKGAFVENDDHSGQYLHDEAEALKAFERAKQEFGSKMELTIQVWYVDDAGNGGDVAFYGLRFGNRTAV